MTHDFEDLGVLMSYELDFDTADRMDFEIRTKEYAMDTGDFFYIDGTEYGGIIDSVQVNTKDDEIIYTGRNWRGILASHILQRGTIGYDRSITDELNYRLKQFDLNSIFVCDDAENVDDVEDITVDDSFSYYPDESLYNAFIEVSYYLNLKLLFEFHEIDHKVHIIPTFTTDYTEYLAYCRDNAIDFQVKQNSYVINHLICYSKDDEGKDRRIHLFLNAKGNVISWIKDYNAAYNISNATWSKTIVDPIQDTDYLLDQSRKYYKGVDENTYVLECSPSYETNYIQINDRPSDWEKKYRFYFTRVVTGMELMLIGESSTIISEGQSQKPTIAGEEVEPYNGDLVVYDGKEFIYFGEFQNGGKWTEFGSRFLGVSTTKVTSGGTEKPTINGEAVTPKNGDIVVYGSGQFIFSNSWKVANVNYIGDSTTQIKAGSDKKPTIDNKKLTPLNGNLCTYNGREFIFLGVYGSGGQWERFSDIYLEDESAEVSYNEVLPIENVSFTMLTKRPSNWSKNYDKYYTHTGPGTSESDFSKVSVQTVNDGYKRVNKKPSDWKFTYTYYLKREWDGTRYVYSGLDAISHNKYVLQTREPDDWEENWSSYYFKKSWTDEGTNKKHNKEFVHTESVEKTWYYHDGKKISEKECKKLQKQWKKVKHAKGETFPKYVKKSEQSAPKWKKRKYYTHNTYTTPPKWPGEVWLEKTKETPPSWETQRYWKATTTRTAPTWKKYTYFTPVYDHYSKLVEEGLRFFKDNMISDTQRVTLTDFEVNVGDTIGGVDEITGIELTDIVTNVIVKYKNGILQNTQYIIGGDY